MSKPYDFAVQKAAIAGRFEKDYELTIKWLPQYIEGFSQAMKNIELDWRKCNFIRDAQDAIPESYGVYCFSTKLGKPFADDLHIPLYIGKAAQQYLSERFKDYLGEAKSIKGRKKVVFMLNKYRNRLVFWWAELPRIHVDAVEEHLLMCCQPPCNEFIPSRNKHWGKAF
ncbi:MAG: hypothetical protein LDL41_23545 [Coleofasciculus sp. S288]|nr:hypothetical protein [Coleofasciculus sp. S288]